MAMKLTVLSVRLRDEHRQALRRAAAADDRSMAAYVERLLLQHLRAGGWLKDEPPR